MSGGIRHGKTKKGHRPSIAPEKLPDYRGVTDYGALDGARTRHCAKFWAPPSTPNPTTTPPALLQSLVRLPAREHSNELYAATAAAGVPQGQRPPGEGEHRPGRGQTE
ncbi:hypothetical protein [Streptomyces cyaneofuscatus]|uniref:hypothetical protein n=1 Tax=Streptomyces cyaneofuscatus TaxID=66883 RepID=UPI002F91097C|nr:hypothetical protein OG973_36615 [Streptomyces cyaneofuscatus]